MQALAQATGSAAIASLTGDRLLGERAALNGFRIPGRRSAGGQCQLLAARGGWVALNLARDSDRDLLPALFGTTMIDTSDLGEIAELTFASDSLEMVMRGREMGLALAASNEVPDSCAARSVLFAGTPAPPPQKAPLVVDLSSLWSGPLCGDLLRLAGAHVIKVESRQRPDAMRDGDPAFFNRLNHGKDSLVLDLPGSEGAAELNRLIGQADIVIEASRPRALAHMGIDAEAHIARSPGKTWITITGHGASDDRASWIGFGDDCGVAGGLSQALHEATGSMGFVGDAIADPLSGLTAARAAWDHWSGGTGGRIGIGMSGVVAMAIADERAADAIRFDHDLKAWAAAAGRPFPALDLPPPSEAARPLGADNQTWLSC